MSSGIILAAALIVLASIIKYLHKEHGPGKKH